MTPIHFVVEGEHDIFVVEQAPNMIELFVKQDNCRVSPNLHIILVIIVSISMAMWQLEEAIWSKAQPLVLM